ncbi:MAG: RES family NAD+ phosphorylase [Nitrospirae bacterium]|nr:RES family NAD+ phosphorylase [Nitrospirota bacterium]
MITAWRIVKKKYVKGVLSGEGARGYPGRWNLYGIPMVYVCSTPSLAILEVRVHTGPEGEGIPYVLFQLETPKDLVIKLNIPLPSDWRLNPPQLSTQNIGSEWAQSGRSAVLQVPSVIVPKNRVRKLSLRTK